MRPRLGFVLVRSPVAVEVYGDRHHCGGTVQVALVMVPHENTVGQMRRRLVESGRPQISCMFVAIPSLQEIKKEE